MSDDDDIPDSDGEDGDERPAVQRSAVERDIVNAGKPKRNRKPKGESPIQREAREGEQFWQWVFSTPFGRREMWKLLSGDDSAHAFNTNFGVHPRSSFPDQNAQWYQRGEQDFGLRQYHKWFALAPQGVLLMHQEHDPRFAKPKRRPQAPGES